MSRMQFRLLAIDDDSKVLDAYNALFQPGSNWMDALAMLAGGEPKRGEDEDEEFEFQLECQLSGKLGVESLRKALEEQNPFSVVFLDMRMPNGWSGLETAREIRKLDENIRIVLVSAYTDYSLKEIRAEIGSRFVFHLNPANHSQIK